MPRISIIVPTLNRPVRLRACLEALNRLQYPRQQFEVIVVNDGGSDDLSTVLGSLMDGLSVRVIRQQNVGPAGARNTGVEHARGEFLAFTDDDCLPEPSWLTVLAQCLEDDPSRIYGGHTVNALANNIYSSASQSLIDYLYRYYNADVGQARFLTSNNIAMARDAFIAVGGFDASFPRASGEDRDLCDRWLKRGFRMNFVHEARVLHAHELDLRSFWRQHFNYGTGAWRFRQQKRLRDGRGPKVEPLGFYVGLVSFARRHGLRPAIPISLLLMLSQVANACGFVSAWMSGVLPGTERAGRAVKATRD